MKIILSVLGVIFLSVSSSAGIEEGELDRTGLECEVSHKEYDNLGVEGLLTHIESKLKYLSGENCENR